MANDVSGAKGSDSNGPGARPAAEVEDARTLPPDVDVLELPLDRAVGQGLHRARAPCLRVFRIVHVSPPRKHHRLWASLGRVHHKNFGVTMRPFIKASPGRTCKPILVGASYSLSVCPDPDRKDLRITP